MRTFTPVVVATLLCLSSAHAADGPATFDALWAGYDPSREPLDVDVVRGWEQDGVEMRYVVFTVGTFKGERARVAAYYGYPRGASANHRVPGLLHMHGGGQRAFQHEVLYYAKRGYACLSVNWGGRDMEDQKKGEPNTDWGAVDPTQTNVPGYINFDQGEHYADDGVSARNNNWYLLTLSGRRGLTFLEQRPEVDASRLGVYGHSMGGNLTVYISGTDDRVKVAAPSVGGTGFRSYVRPLLPPGTRPQWLGKRVDLYRATMAFEQYAPHIKAPILWLNSTNDFHGQMDDMYRTGDLVTHAPVRYSVAPHLNHRFTPEFEIARPMWIDQHLKSGPKLPHTPQTELQLKTRDGVPRLIVRPDRGEEVARVDVYYSVDSDPKARFWRSANAAGGLGGVFEAKLPIASSDRPLYAFASVRYPLAEAQELYRGVTTDAVAVSSVMHTAMPEDLKKAGVTTSGEPQLLITDFRFGMRDWYSLNANNRHHWQHWTRKITDPLWRGPDGASLRVTLEVEQDNKLVIIAKENEWRHYRGPNRSYVAVVDVKIGGVHTFDLVPGDFREVKSDKPLKSWSELDQLGLAARYENARQKGELHGGEWRGDFPRFYRIEWTTEGRSRE